jgi:hypothetical protein
MYFHLQTGRSPVQDIKDRCVKKLYLSNFLTQSKFRNQKTASTMKSSMNPLSFNMRPLLKTTAFVLSLLTLTITHSYAQSSLQWGLKAGGNYFKLGGRSFDNTYNVSFSGGAYAEVNYSAKWTIQPELLFNQTQGKTSQEFNQIYGGVSDQLVTLDYITIPILVAFKPIPELSILLGPQYGFLISQTTGLLNPGGTTSANSNQNAFSRSDFSIVFGGQLNLGKVKVGLRYSEGINNINRINSTDSWRQFGLQAYFAFQIKDMKLRKK